MITLFKRKQKEPTIFDCKPTFRSTGPKNRPSFNDWAREYRVSSCFERVKIVYIQTGSLL